MKLQAIILVSMFISMAVLSAYHVLILPEVLEHQPRVSAVYTVNLRETARKVKEEMLARAIGGEEPDPDAYRKRISKAFNEMLKTLPPGSVVLEEEVVASGMAGRLNLLGKSDEGS